MTVELKNPSQLVRDDLTEEEIKKLLKLNTRQLRIKLMSGDEYVTEAKISIRAALDGIASAADSQRVANINWKSMLRTPPMVTTLLSASRLVAALRYKRAMARKAVRVAERVYEGAVRGPLKTRWIILSMGGYIKERLLQPSFAERILPVEGVKKPSKKTKTKPTKKPVLKKKALTKRGIKAKKRSK